MFRLTDPTNKVVPIPKVKFAHPAVVSSSCTEVSNCSNTFSGLILPVNGVEAAESISNPSNSILLYYKSLNKLKT